MGSAAEVAKAFDRIREWLDARDKTRTILETLRKPATPKQIESFEKAMKLKLPDEVKALYELFDGQDGNPAEGGDPAAGLLPSGEPGDLAHLVLPLKGVREEMPRKPGDGMPGFKAGWLPVGSNFSGDHFVIDLSTDDPKRRGRVLQFSHERAGARVAAPSLAALLKQIAAGLKDGSIVFDEELGLSVTDGVDWDELELEHGPLPGGED